MSIKNRKELFFDPLILLFLFINLSSVVDPIENCLQFLQYFGRKRKNWLAYSL